MGIEFKHRVLPNGLTVIAEVDPSAHSAAAGYFVRTGARDEPAPVMGVSHFLEHMMFKGTDTISAEQLNETFDDLGARHNAYTSSEVTCFYAHVLPDVMDEAVGLLSRMMRPALREDDFDTEKNVILEEIAMYADNPFWVLYEECMDRYYRPHAMGHRVLGTNETIRALTREQMAGYFSDRYAPDNMVLSLAGKVDFDRMCDLADSVCGDWKPSGTARDLGSPGANAETFRLTDESHSRGYLLGVAPGPAQDDDRRHAASILAKVLGGGGNSRLHWALVEEGIAEEAMAEFSPHDGCGTFLVYASGEPDRLETFAEVINREIAGLLETITETDLERIRNRILTGETTAGEKPEGRMQRLGRRWSAVGEYMPLEEKLAKINAVTLEDLAAVAGAFDPTPRLIGTLAPS